MTENFALKRAAERLVKGFDNIPQRWLIHVAEAVADEEVYAWPMWGTCFKVGNMDRGAIERLMRDMIPDDLHELIAFAEDRGIDLESLHGVNAMELVALAASDPDEIDDDDVDELRNAIQDDWRDSGDDDAYLADAGWQEVGSTGILAREIDGELILGINGAGYDFYASHWIPLYKELGYEWHHGE